MTDGSQNNNGSGGPEGEKPLVDPEALMTPEGAADSTEEAVEEVLNDAMSIEDAKKVDYSTMSLGDYMKNLELGPNPDAQAKLHKIQMVLLFLAAKSPGVTDEDLKKKVLLKKFEGNQLGQAYEQFVALDPVLLLKDDLTLARRALLHEYVMHMEKDLDHEGLAELGASLYDNGKPKDYFNLVHNVRPVVETIGGDDGMLAGFETVAELFAAKKHEELFIKFKEAFKGTEEEAISVFQLAFPTLKVGKTGEYVEDDEGIEEQVALVKAENAPTES